MVKIHICVSLPISVEDISKEWEKVKAISRDSGNYENFNFPKTRKNRCKRIRNINLELVKTYYSY